MAKANEQLRDEILTFLDCNYPRQYTTRDISQNMSIAVTPRQIYNSIRNMPLETKLKFQVAYGSGLFVPNKYSFKFN